VLDCVLRNGFVVDGTGVTGRAANVAIEGGKVVAVGDVTERARRVVDVGGLVVAPGFIDIHTHYDAQFAWDPTASPSLQFGFTTVIGGNCGFTLAPCPEANSEYLVRLLAKVEGMPLAALENSLDWTWHTFGQWLDSMDGKAALNLGFNVGHSTLRHVVMGERRHETPTAAELDAMRRLLGESLEQGALGLSSSTITAHRDHNNDFVPSRMAQTAEWIAFAEEVGRHAGTYLQAATGLLDGFSDEDVDMMTTMSKSANRCLNWNVLTVDKLQEDTVWEKLAVSDVAQRAGGRVVGLTLPAPHSNYIDMQAGFMIHTMPGWVELFNIGVDERVERLAQPDERQRLKVAADAARPTYRKFADFDRYRICQTFASENKQFEGQTAQQVAAAKGIEPFDALIEVVVADRLKTVLEPPPMGADDESWQLRAKVVQDSRVVVGGSDAGAHVDVDANWRYPSDMLGTMVRDRQLLPLETAIRLMTDAPAKMLGLRYRGRIASGFAADIVVFDLDRIGAGPLHTRNDMPGGGKRLYADAYGIEHVIVNGVEVLSHGVVTGATPGTVLRSGRDTETHPARP
jgi:N-acyl-D-aspartate/D-glutamate deacylase